MSDLKTTTDQAFGADSKSAPVVLIKLTADWCGPCKMYNPVLKQFSDDTDVPVFNLDIDSNPVTPRAFAVLSIPTVLVYVDGELRDQLVGVRPLAKLRHDLSGLSPTNG